MKSYKKYLLGVAASIMMVFGASTTTFAEEPELGEAYNIPTGEIALRRKYVFQLPDGTVLGEQVLVDGDYIYEPEAPVEDGMTFLGWYDENFQMPDYYTPIYGITEPDEVVVLTAAFIPVPDVVNFHTIQNGDDIVYMTRTAINGTVDCRWATVPTSPDVEVVSWASTDGDYRCAVSGSGTTLSGVSGTIDLYPEFESLVTVIYDTMGGPKLQPAYIKPGSTVQNLIPVRPGYTFKGWREQGASTNFNFSTRISEDTTLEAQWQAEMVSYVIVIRADGVAVQVITGREALADTDVTVLASDPEIVFESMTSYTGTDATETVSGDGTTIIYVDFVRQETPAIEPTEVTAPYATPAEPKIFTVEFNLNGGDAGTSGAFDDQTVIEDDYATEPTEEPTRDGYQFAGYLARVNGSLVPYTFGNSPINSVLETTSGSLKIELVAQWIQLAQAVTICYYDYDGDILYSEASGYTPFSIISLRDYREIGGMSEDNFVGWTFDSNLEKHDYGTMLFNANMPIPAFAGMFTGEVSLYAIFDYDAPTTWVTFYDNIDENDPWAGFVEYVDLPNNADFEVIPNPFARDGYHFVGWNTEPDGSGVWYYPGDIVAPNNDWGWWSLNELYAIWEEDEAEIAAPETGRVTATAGGVVSTHLAGFVASLMFAGIVFFAEWRKSVRK